MRLWSTVLKSAGLRHPGLGKVERSDSDVLPEMHHELLSTQFGTSLSDSSNQNLHLADALGMITDLVNSNT